MNKRERVLAAMHCQDVDRVPVGFWFHFPEDDCTGEAGIRRHLDYYRAIDGDFLKIMCDGFFGYPNEIIPTLRQASDWNHIKPLGPDHPFIRDQIDRCKAINEVLQGECCTFYNVFNPMSSLRFGTSDELLMTHLDEDPEAVLHAIDVIAEDNLYLAERCITEGGCDGVYYCVQNAEVRRFTAKEYNTYVRPGDLKVLSHANQFSENNILHCCGWAGDKNRLEVWQDYEARAVNWAVTIEEMSLAEGWDFFGHRCVIGGFDNRPRALLTAGTKEEIQAFTRGLIAGFGKKGLIIGGDCAFSRGINVNRFAWVMEAAAQC